MRKSHLTFRSELPRSGRLQRNSRSALRANLGLAEASDNTIQRECPKCDNFLKFFRYFSSETFSHPVIHRLIHGISTMCKNGWSWHRQKTYSKTKHEAFAYIFLWVGVGSLTQKTTIGGRGYEAIESRHGHRRSSRCGDGD